MGINAVVVVNNNYSGGVGETSPFLRQVSFAKVAEDFGTSRAPFRTMKS